MSKAALCDPLFVSVATKYHPESAARTLCLLGRCWMCGWPELLALLHGLTSGLAPAESLALLLPTGLALRLAWLAAALLHGLGHLLILALLDPRPLAVDWSWIREGRSLAALTGSLLPLAPIGPAAGPPDQPAWLSAGDPTPWKVRCKAAGGVLLNLLVALAAWRAQEAAPALALLAGANLAMALLSRSDLDAVLTGQGRRLQCGNFGVITVPEAPLQGDLLPGAVLRLYERMGKETELRGSQAGGGLMLTRDRDGSPRFIGHKIVNAKRGDLTASLEAGFRRRRRLARLAGSRCDPATLLACWHYRFGTSGPPAVQETHWLQWLPARRRPIYTPGPQGWTRNQQLVQNRITHNGDFEAFAIGNSEVDVLSELGVLAGERPAAARTRCRGFGPDRRLDGPDDLPGGLAGGGTLGLPGHTRAVPGGAAGGLLRGLGEAVRERLPAGQPGAGGARRGAAARPARRPGGRAP